MEENIDMHPLLFHYFRLFKANMRKTLTLEDKKQIFCAAIVPDLEAMFIEHVTLSFPRQRQNEKDALPFNTFPSLRQFFVRMRLTRWSELMDPSEDHQTLGCEFLENMAQIRNLEQIYLMNEDPADLQVAQTLNDRWSKDGSEVRARVVTLTKKEMDERWAEIEREHGFVINTIPDVYESALPYNL